MFPPAKERVSRLEKTTEALQPLRDRTESVRPTGPTPAVDSTETAMGNNAKEQQIPVEPQERISQDPAFKNMVAAYQELVQQENTRRSLGRGPVVEVTLRRLTSMLKPPPKFDGRVPREWLMQIERYHALVGVPETVRVQDAFNYLQGPVLSDYCLVASDGTEPVTWSKLRNFVLDRFSCHGIGETIRKLRELRWEGSLDRLAMRFASVLAQGVPHPQTDWVRLFLGRVPLHMVVALPDEECRT